MSITIQIKGLEELRAALTNLEGALETAVSDAIEDTAIAIRSDVITAMKKPGRGRLYTRGGVSHQASAPGDPPATDTGRLIGSVFMELSPLKATVGSNVVYARYLEFGTRRMAPRPVWRATAETQGEELRDRIIKNIRSII